MQFETDAVMDTTLSMSEELYNTKYKDKLNPEHKGLVQEVFITIHRDLSSAKVTKPGNFRSNQDGYAVKSSFKAEDGVLYPIEKSFFFLPKPPTVILHEEEPDVVAYSLYVRSTMWSLRGILLEVRICIILIFSSSLKMSRSSSSGTIQRNEYHSLFDFISIKGLKIMNLGSAKSSEGVAAVLQSDDDDAVDPHLERIKNEAAGNESDEEDEDFVLDKDDGGCPTDDPGQGESDASDSGGEKEAPHKKKSKKDLPSFKAVPSSKRAKDGDDDELKKKKQKKKKDPRRAISAFMFF